MNREIRILAAVTPIHVGEGSAVGSVDLPVARERHTRWPFVPGSEIKGALRERARLAGVDDALVLEAFGDPPMEEGGGALAAEERRRGSVVFGQATLLALAVRSLFGGMALLTCPLALGRFARAAGIALPRPSPSREGVLLAKRSKLSGSLGNTTVAVLEDLPFAPRPSDEAEEWALAIERWRDASGEGAPARAHLAIVHDDVFAHACRAWLPTRTRAAIDPKTGVVESGKLFTVEALPPESLLWWPVGLAGRDEAPVREHVLPRQGEVFAVGGQRTVGAGRLAVLEAQGGAA